MCIKKLLKGKKNTCPQDGKTHITTNGIKSFLENKYLLKHLNERSPPGKGPKLEIPEFWMCKTHGREVNLYCKNRSCQGEICSLCMIENHKSHNVVDLSTVKESVRTNLASEIATLKDDLKFCQEKFKKARKRIDKHYTETIETIYATRVAFLSNIDGKITKIQDDLKMLSIPDNGASYQDKTKVMEAAKDTKIWLQNELKNDIKYTYYGIKETYLTLDTSKELFRHKLGKRVKPGKYS